MENTLENILEMGELKRAKERTEVKLAMLETEEPMKCKPANPEKFKEGGRVHIQAWLGVMENHLHASNTSLDFWVDIAQNKIEARKRLKVAVNPLNDVQPWEDFHRLVTYAICIDSNSQQVKFELGIAPI